MCNSTLTDLRNDHWREIFGSIMVTISLLATMENTIVLYVLRRYHTLHTISYKILSVLAIANLFTGVILGPLFSAQLFNEHILNNCYVDLTRRYISAVLLGASSLTLALIAYDRREHLKSLHCYQMSKKKFYWVITLCWVLPCMMPAFRLVDEDEKAYGIVIIVFNVLIGTVIITCYASLLFAIKSHRKNSRQRQAVVYLQNEMRAGKAIVTIIILSLLMLAPTLIHCILKLSQQMSNTTAAESYIFSMTLGMLNAVVNPVVYCYRIPVLKTHIIRCLRLHTRKYRISATACRFTVNGISPVSTVHWNRATSRINHAFKGE